MYRKDYIVKQLEEFGKVMAVILTFKRNNDWEKFSEEIAVASKKYTLLEVEFAENLAMPDFIRELEFKGLNPEQQKMLADLLYEKMIYYIQNGKSVDYLELRSKCLFLYQSFSQNLTQNDFNLDVHYKLDLLKNLK